MKRRTDKTFDRQKYLPDSHFHESDSEQADAIIGITPEDVDGLTDLISMDFSVDAIAYLRQRLSHSPKALERIIETASNGLLTLDNNGGKCTIRLSDSDFAMVIGREGDLDEFKHKVSCALSMLARYLNHRIAEDRKQKAVVSPDTVIATVNKNKAKKVRSNHGNVSEDVITDEVRREYNNKVRDGFSLGKFNQIVSSNSDKSTKLRKVNGLLCGLLAELDVKSSHQKKVQLGLLDEGNREPMVSLYRGLGQDISAFISA